MEDVSRIPQHPAVSLPIKKWSSPEGRVVCWHCRRPDTTLYHLLDTDGKKTPDYACADCKALGLPPIGDISVQKFRYQQCDYKLSDKCEGTIRGKGILHRVYATPDAKEPILKNACFPCDLLFDND